MWTLTTTCTCPYLDVWSPGTAATRSWSTAGLRPSTSSNAAAGAQCGGHSRPCQGPTETEAAITAIDAGRSGHIHVLDEAAHWRVLLQIPEADHLGMIWGDRPVAYWMIHDDDLKKPDFDHVWFTMQS